MKYQIRLLRLAEQDVREIVHWLSERSRSGATSWVKAYQQMLGRLAHRADTYALAAESDDFDYELLEIIFKTRRGLPYRAVFTIAEGEVRVLRIRGPGQDDLSPNDIEES